MDKTILTVNGLELEYVREKEAKSIRAAKTSTLCFFVIILSASILLFWFQVSKNSFFSELAKYIRIKNSVKGWRPLVNAKTKLESDRGRLMSLNRNDLFSFNCLDYGPYFLATRIDKKTFLPQAIRRGDGDAWMVKKANKVDLSAQQFCEYIVSKYDDTITCGFDMMDKIGYSGYFMDSHWCSEFHNLLN
ncbi:73R [Yaba monkey tumor virus]|uniref:73R n=1 Tax=Yaba monkey tumor virus (strain VR587) TaxID=928314 RepID=Q6TUU2_YMTV5|nr:putative viral membrane protein [Yaba monkey tumor virus]AAR07429.1 73R [Yaba monkey tumor virus]